jgi:hypothetical protein
LSALVKPLYCFDRELSNTRLVQSKAYRRSKLRSLSALAKAGKPAREAAYALKASKRRLYSLYVLQFVLRNVGSLLPASFKDRPVDQQVAEALRIGGDWVKGKADRGGFFGPFTVDVFKEAICQLILVFLGV